jgi:L-lactate utilization protein LutC
MSARDEILGRLRKQNGEASLPAPWRSRRQFTDLAARFSEALTAVKGEVRRAADLDGALEEVAQILEEIKATRGIVDDDPLLDKIDLAKRWPDVNWFTVGRNEGDLRQFAAAADVGISIAEAALAETGSVVVSSGPGRSRFTSLLPPVHLALVPTSRLTPDIFTWIAGHDRQFPSSLTLISGPSKTADIEQTMAIGVHGPGRFVAILYES